MVYGMMLFFDANVEMARFPPEIGRGIWDRTCVAGEGVDRVQWSYANGFSRPIQACSTNRCFPVKAL